MPRMTLDAPVQVGTRQRYETLTIDGFLGACLCIVKRPRLALPDMAISVQTVGPPARRRGQTRMTEPMDRQECFAYRNRK
jgi:hypothetical protein